MTPMALYQTVTRVALFVGSSVIIWMAAFFVLCWLLHYEPRQIEPVPKSRRELIVLTAFATGIGTAAMVRTATGGFDYSILLHMPIFGCMSSLFAFVSLAFAWISIVELRRAVHLRRHPFHQQVNEHPRAIGDQ